MGLVLVATGDYEAASAYMERALVIIEAMLGTNHPSTNIVRGNLAALLREIEANS
ncbi:MAG: hypothetical protein CL608_24970 [Anaerolineaceae bacterium]|nr:hypothetical protein [Anaerolineaceae bacterium]